MVDSSIPGLGRCDTFQMVRRRQQSMPGIRFGVTCFRLRKGVDSKEKAFGDRLPGSGCFTTGSVITKTGFGFDLLPGFRKCSAINRKRKK